MANSKATKKALFGSVVSLLLCFTMLIGATFAWFTDNVKNTGNKILAGDLEVELLMYDGSDYQDISENTKPIFGAGSIAQDNHQETLWEPGKTQVAYLGVRNGGNLALKYNVILDIADKGLAGALEYVVVPGQAGVVTDWASIKDQAKALPVGNVVAAPEGTLDEIRNNVQDETDYFALVIHMKEDAGNEYENKSVEIDVLVSATQVEAEFDSFGNEYDKDAGFAVADGVYRDENDGSLFVLSEEALSSVSKLASEDNTITSVKYKTDSGEVEVPVVTSSADLTAAAKDKEEIVVVTSGTYSIPTGMTNGQEITIVGNEDTKIVNTGIAYPGGSAVNFSGVTINTSGYGNGMGNGVKATYTNCVFNAADLYLYGSAKFIDCTFNDCGTYALWTWGASTAEFDGCVFNTTGKAIYVNANYLDNGGNHQTVIINDCKFYDTGANSIQKAAIETGDDYNKTTYDIFITKSTFEGFAVTEDKTATWNYGGSDFGTNVWGNKYLMGTDKLNVVIDGVDVH